MGNKKFLACYWIEKNDEAVDCETIIEAYNFDEAYTKFREQYRLAKIESIKWMY
jgi:hypothetical protein